MQTLTTDHKGHMSMENTERPLLEMRQIIKRFAGGTVLHGVDFQVRPGTVHALVGANGAGKSTLMKILAGVYPDYEGEIVVDGTSVEMRNPRTGIDVGIAVIYQENSLVPDLSVADNIALGREPNGWAPGFVNHQRDRLRSEEETKSLDIALPLNSIVRDLQVGEQQMTEIVKAVARKAKILVMDEPTARLSPEERARLFDIVRRLTKQGVGIIFISHFLEEVFEICSEVTVLRDGRCVSHHSTADSDVHHLARLMVGDKIDEFEGDVADRRSLAEGGQSPVGLRLDEVSLPGRISPITLEVPRGSVLCITGLDNSGRSELASILVGAVNGGAGHIVVGDQYKGVLPSSPIDALKAGLFMVPADRKNGGIVELRSVAENIALSGLRGHLSRRGFRRRRAAKALVSNLSERFDIQPRLPDLPITALSGGNQQKVLFARAVAADASVLLLDQPTAGVDIGAKVDLYRQVDRLASEGMTIILFSDDLTEILRLSDEIVIMHNGVAEPPRSVAEFDRASLLAAITSPTSRGARKVS